MVEFALIVPILLLLVFGIIEFGIVYNTKIAITNAAREGARKAAVTSVDTDAVKTAITNSVASLNDTVSSSMDEDAKDSSIIPAPDTIDWYVEVTGSDTASVYVKGRVDIIVPIINLITGPNLVIPAKAEMRIE